MCLWCGSYTYTYLHEGSILLYYLKINKSCVVDCINTDQSNSFCLRDRTVLTWDTEELVKISVTPWRLLARFS